MDRLIPMPNSFYEALANADVKNMHDMYITESYVSMRPAEDCNIEAEIMYDADLGEVMTHEEWTKVCGAAHAKKEREKQLLLEKAGLNKSFQAVRAWLASGDTVKIEHLNCDDASNPFTYIKAHSLSYGYKMAGFERYGRDIVWQVWVYDRVVEENDCLRGMDMAYLLYDGSVHEVTWHSSYEEQVDGSSCMETGRELVFIGEKEGSDRGKRFRVFMNCHLAVAESRYIKLSVPYPWESGKPDRYTRFNLGCAFILSNGAPVLDICWDLTGDLGHKSICSYTYDEFKRLGGTVFLAENGSGGETVRAEELKEPFESILSTFTQADYPVKTETDDYMVRQVV